MLEFFHRVAFLILCGMASGSLLPVMAAELSLGNLENGRSLYLEHCSDCHGTEGKGDGPRAALLAPGPGNLVSAATSAKSNQELLRIVSQGVPRTAMQGWKERLSEQERLDVLAFIRSLVRFQSPSLTPAPPQDAE